MTDHLTDDDLRRARKIAEARFADLPHRDEDWEIVARAILALVPDPGPERLQGWSDDLVGTFVDYGDEYIEGLLVVSILERDGYAVTVKPGRSGYWMIRAEDCTPRLDLAPVDLTPRPIESEATPRTVTTADEYAALPEGSVVAQPEDGILLLMSGRWHDPLGRGPYTHDLMRGITSVLLREGWGE